MGPDDKTDAERIEFHKERLDNIVEVNLTREATGWSEWKTAPGRMTDYVNPTEFVDWQLDNAKEVSWLQRQLETVA